SLFRSRVLAHETNALGHVRQRVLPVVLVFSGYVAAEALPFQFIEDFLDLDYAGAVRHVVMAGVAEHVAVFHMTADDASFQYFQSVHRINARSQPMPRVRARADATVAVLHHGQNVMRVPHFVVRVVGTFRMIVEPYANVIFLHELLDGVDGFHGRRGYAVKAEFPGELKDFPRAGLVLWDANDAVVDGLEVMLGELVFDFLNDLRRRVMVPFYVRLPRAEL